MRRGAAAAFVGVVSAFLVLSACNGGPEIGAFGALWTITQGGDPTTCEAAGVAAVEVEAASADGMVYATRFPCDMSEGVTGYMPPDDYEIKERCLDDGFAPLGESPRFPVTLHPGRIVDLSVVRFEITPSP